MLRISFIFLAALPLVAQDGAEALAVLKKNCAGCHNVNSDWRSIPKRPF
jgi:mono/diheme cytochrome c family protein